MTMSSQKLYLTAKALFDGLTHYVAGSIITNDLTRVSIMQHRLRFIGAKEVHSNSQLSDVFFQYFGLDNGSTVVRAASRAMSKKAMACARVGQSHLFKN